MSEDRSELRKALGRTPGCPEIELLGRYADGVLEAARRPALESHIGACSHCQSELELLRNFAEVALRPEEEWPVAWIQAQLQDRRREIFAARPLAQSTEVSWWRALFATPVLTRAALVMGCLLVIASVSMYLRRGAAPALNTRIDSGAEVMRSNAVPLVAPKGDLETKPAALQWQPVLGASRYQVRILEVDRTELWKTETSDTSALIPDSVEVQIRPAKSLLWQVIALDASGRQLGSSSLERFRVVPHVPQEIH